MMLLWVAALPLTIALSVSVSSSSTAGSRPSLLQSEKVFYLGVGSNLLASKVKTRSLNGTITPISTTAAYVPNSRLAFNLRGFPPFEPSMGGFEFSDTLGDECHGNLMELSREDYEKLWLSEGGGAPNPGYEEVEIDAYPYGSSPGSPPVRAIALRARPHAKLRVDGPPSRRYLSILIEGAAELGLSQSYMEKLRTIVPSDPPPYLKLIGFYSFFLTSFLFRNPKTRKISLVNNKMLNLLFVHPTSRPLYRMLSNLALTLWLLPTAFIGLFIRMSLFIRRKPGACGKKRFR